jgi:hypothetical protein
VWLQFKNERQRVDEDHWRNVEEDLRRHERAVCLELLRFDVDDPDTVNEYDAIQRLTLQVDDEPLRDLTRGQLGWEFQERAGYVMRTPRKDRTPDGHRRS